MQKVNEGTSHGEKPPARRLADTIATRGYRLLSTPKAVAVTLLLVYGTWICGVLAFHPSPFTFVNPGRNYIQLADQLQFKLPSLPSHYGATVANPSPNGYDGQFTYYIALHPGRARFLLDVPWYRYQRILEPLLLKGLSWGHPILIPWLMLAVSLAAVVGGTWALATWLASHGHRPAWALLYGLWPGLVVTVRNDLTDGLAYGLVALAILLLDRPGRSRPTLSALVIGLAVFARQEVAVFGGMMALAIAAGTLPQRDGRDVAPLRSRLIGAAKFGAIAFGPFCIYLVYLSHWLRSVPSPISSPPSVPPAEMIADIVMLVVPAIILVGAIRPTTFALRSRDLWGWSTYALHVAALTGFMIVGRVGVYYSWSYSTVFRYYIPVALAAVLCYGCVPRPSRARSTVALVCGGLAMVALPIVAIKGM
jgi:hypothetical protein